jgi:hypothetical protein
MKKLLLAAVLAAFVAVFTLLGAATALAGPAHSALVFNVTYKVINDEALGNQGYWALQDYNRHVQVWQSPNGKFYWESQFEGKWTTSAGALSPGNGITQTAGGSGTFKAVLDGTFEATGYTPGFGNLGTHDFRGIMGDVLLGYYTYPDDETPLQAGPPDAWSCGIYFYFPLDEEWLTWQTTAYTRTYRYKYQTWNFDNGSTTGDIVIK